MVMKDYVKFLLEKDGDEITIRIIDMWECTTIDTVYCMDEDLFDTLADLDEEYSTIDKTIILDTER